MRTRCSTIAIVMSTSPQHHPTAKYGRFYTFKAGFFAVVVLAVLQAISPARSSEADHLFYSEHPPGAANVLDRPIAVGHDTGFPSSDGRPILFGMSVELVVRGDVVNKWNHARTEIARELQMVDRCRKDNVCSASARKLIRLSAEGAGRNGRARLGLINRAVNLAISPTSDETQWQVPDRWSSALETLQSERGDCEDYAIVKYLALLDSGISDADLKIVVIRNLFPNEDHAVVAARVDAEWLILDNRTLTLVRDTNLARTMPMFVLDQVGVWRFVSGAPHRTRGWAS